METKGIDKFPRSLRFAGRLRHPGAGVLGKFFSQEAVMEVSGADRNTPEEKMLRLNDELTSVQISELWTHGG